MPTTSIPSIDLSLFTHGTPSQRCSVIAAFDHAARTVGFLQLHSHPIPPPTLSAVLSAAATFFALPQNQKLASSPSTPAQNRGYSPPSSESLALSLSTSQPSPPDTFEAFNVGPEPVDYADPFFAAERHRFFAPNIWPTTPAPLRPATNAYFAHAHAVALIVTQIIGEALGTDFSPITDRSTTTMRVINYTPANDGPSNGETGAKRMGAHTDYGLVTILYADPVQGLQIFTSGAWHDVTPLPASLIVNFGDMAALITNDRYLSTLHRVVPSPHPRRSIAFFLDANYDALISCIPSCVDDGDAPRYKPVVAGDHLMAKILGPRTGTRSAATTDTTAERRSAAEIA